MKKILSAVLAAAMVLSMGVMAFADVTLGGGPASVDHDYDVQKLQFGAVHQVRDDEFVQRADGTEEFKDLRAGDELYFAIHNENGWFNWDADKDWKIKVNNANYVEGAKFFFDDEGYIGNGNCLYVKVTLADDFDTYEEDEVKFYFYIYDEESHKESVRVRVSYDFASYQVKPLDAEDLNWVVVVEGPTTYEYDKHSKAKKATLDFNEAAFVELKMYPGEKYTVSGVQKYNKELSKEYDVEVETIDLRGIDGADVVLPSSKDNKQVVMVVDGEFVAVEAEYVKGYKFESGKKADGYLVENAEAGAYALIDADIELEEVEDEKKPADKDENKENPGMGANDFVGAAVALAVVSVAAAGALALKK